MLTVIKGVSIPYELAVPVALAKATQQARQLGTWLGDIGNEFHQFEGGDPAAGRRHGDHTPWSADGPRGVVKAFDWAPDNMARFQTWFLGALRSGRYEHAVKFINLNNRQYGPRGQYQGHTADHHLHVSFFPGAVKARVDVLADYLADVTTTAPSGAEEDDMKPDDPVDQPTDITLPGQSAKSPRIKGKSAKWLWWAIYQHTLSTEAQVVTGNAADATRDSALQGALTAIISASGGDIDTAAVIAAVQAEADKTRAAVVQVARDQLGAVAEALETAAGQ